MEAKRLIAITTESDYPDEPRLIALMLTEGIDLIHIRKPAWDEERMRSLIASIDERWHNRLVLHSHFRLTEEFGLHGVHLNSRALHAPEGYKGPISCSCHSIQELQERSPQMDYCTLSPIFNSISKSGLVVQRFSTISAFPWSRGRRSRLSAHPAAGKRLCCAA